MTNFFATTNDIGAGTRFTFTEAGDTYTILPGVTVATTDHAPAIRYDAGATDTTVVVGGTLVSGATIFPTAAGSNFVVAPGGRFISHEAAPGNIALFAHFGGSSSTVSIDGALVADRAIGIVAAGAGFVGSVSGSIDAANPVFLGFDGASGHRFVISGRLTASAHDDEAMGTRYYNGIFAEGMYTRITNLAGGIITATGADAAGVRFGSVDEPYDVSGSRFVNEGHVGSLRGWGVDFGEAPAGTTLLVLRNTGTITGEQGAFRGHAGIDVVTNAGTMHGSVEISSGDDLFVATGGTILGNWSGGEGDDRYFGGGASTVTGVIWGGAGHDWLIGGDGADSIYGGDTDGDLVADFNLQLTIGLGITAADILL